MIKGLKSETERMPNSSNALSMMRWNISFGIIPVSFIGPMLPTGQEGQYVLRAWETRYGLLHPPRSTGGFRLYSPADERRVRRMQFHLAQGLSAAEAAAEAPGRAKRLP